MSWINALNWDNPGELTNREAFALSAVMRSIDRTNESTPKKSVLTTKNLHTVARHYAFLVSKAGRIEDYGTDICLVNKMVSSDFSDYDEWTGENKEAIEEITTKLFDIMEYPPNPGFVCYEL